MLIRKSLWVITGMMALVPLLVTAVEGPLEEVVNKLEQWVETERMIAEASSEWEAEKASMENLLEIYKEEVAMLEAQIEAAEEDTSAAEERRAELTSQDTAVKDVEARVEAAIIEAEKNLKGLEAMLPEPLKQELSPLFNSLPEDSDESGLAIGQRVQPLVAILTQVQKFNQVITVTEGFREFEEGRTVQTEKIFMGLGAAFYVDQADEHAGVGVLSDAGWEWQDDNELISVIRQFMEIYRGTQQASYVEVPVTVY